MPDIPRIVQVVSPGECGLQQLRESLGHAVGGEFSRATKFRTRVPHVLPRIAPVEHALLRRLHGLQMPGENIRDPQAGLSDDLRIVRRPNSLDGS